MVMKARNAVIVWCIVWSALLAALSAIAAIMPDVANHWADEGRTLAGYQVVLLRIAAVWSRFWWLGTPVVILLASIPLVMLVLLSNKRPG